MKRTVLLKRNPVCVSVLTDDMLEFLRTGIKSKQLIMECEGVSDDIKIVRPIARPGYIIVKASINRETDKALNLVVELDKTKYPHMPFEPRLFIWIPKRLCNKLSGGYYELQYTIGMENLNNAMVYLKKKLIKEYGFSSSDILKIQGIHLK